MRYHPRMGIAFLDPKTLAPSIAYSHVAIVEAGRQIHLSGQVALDVHENLVGEHDVGAQAAQVYENVRLALEAAGATMAHVFKVVTYVVDLTPEKSAAIRAVRRKYYGEGPYPASTMVGVTSLAAPEFLVEIEVIARLP